MLRMIKGAIQASKGIYGYVEEREYDIQWFVRRSIYTQDYMRMRKDMEDQCWVGDNDGNGAPGWSYKAKSERWRMT